MKKAVMYGAGNIGRGFVGALFSSSGYDVTFVDVDEKIVNTLHEKRRYPVRIVSGDGYEDIEISNVDALNGSNEEAVADAISEADIMATAVGVNILEFIAPNIAAGLKRRFSKSDKPLNIIICENLIDANKVLEGMLKEKLTKEECSIFDEIIGLVEASIGRMVPVQTSEMKDGEPLRVCVEKYGFLPVDREAFKGEIPDIKNMVPFSPFDFYIKRKLYIHNMGHAACAYLGLYTGKEYIYESIDDPEISIIVQNAMMESALALSKKYNVGVMNIIHHIHDLLFRFTNSALKDTCKRVGGDIKRKLSHADRLIGSSMLCLEQGVAPVFIAVGGAGAVYEYLQESGMEQTEDNAFFVLQKISSLKNDEELTGYIMEMYKLFNIGLSVKEIRKAAENIRHSGLKEIV